MVVTLLPKKTTKNCEIVSVTLKVNYGHEKFNITYYLPCASS